MKSDHNETRLPSDQTTMRPGHHETRSQPDQTTTGPDHHQTRSTPDQITLRQDHQQTTSQLDQTTTTRRDHHQASSPKENMSQLARDKVAIIGVGCKFPGANNSEEYWRLLQNGENHVVDIPDSRWIHDSVYDEDFNTPAKTHARKAGLLTDHLAFDNKLFNTKDVEADIMDPQQRYVLESCHRALEDAGLTRDHIKASRTGVVIGAMNTDYRSEFNSTSFVPNNYTVTGVSSSIIANRVSYIYDLRGPSITIDSACSSSMAAIDMGILYLRAGACDMAICGGTSSILTPDVFIHLSKARMSSAKGQCFTFSDQVDGYTRGEGCGIIILKRLTDAIQDNNKIWATVETGCNQDGGTVMPISKPSEEQQIRLLEEVYDKSGIDPKLMDYIEAHGTGTPVGDVTEVNALGRFFQKKQAIQPRYIGSVKTNIGHLESAAGVAGLIKVLLMMEHSMIVPSLHFHTPNPNIDFQGYQLTVPTKLTPWPQTHKVASVSSYGFGGTNCHAIVESFCQEKTANHKSDGSGSDRLVCFSGLSLESLKGSMKDFVNYPNVISMNIDDVSVTSTKHRDHFLVRQAFVASSTENLCSQIQEQVGSVRHEPSDATKPRIVFVFSGMGTSWIGMGKDYMSKSRVFRDTIRQIDKHLQQFVSWSVEDRLDTEYQESDELFWPIAIFSCQLALARLWTILGVSPNCVIGYSVGEVAAAHVAGLLSLADAVKVIYYRSKVLANLVGTGRMILFRQVSIETVEEIVKRWPGQANVSAKISPRTCAVSGETQVVATVEQQVQAEVKSYNTSLEIIDLKLPLAYHSHCVDRCQQELRLALSGIGTYPTAMATATLPGIEMVSTVTGQVLKAPVSSEYWARNVREPVNFLDPCRKTLTDDQPCLYIEVGSRPLMIAHKDDIFPDKHVKVIVSMRSKSKWKTFLEALGTAYKHGCNINWVNLPQSGGLVTPVPRYSFNPRRCLQSSETTSLIMSGINYMRKQHPFVFKQESKNTYKVVLTQLTFASVFDHNVGGSLIIPGAVYVECGFVISRQIQFRQAPRYSVSAVFEQPCRFSEKAPAMLDLDIAITPSECHFNSYSITVSQQQTRFATVYLHPHHTPLDSDTINLAQVNIRCPQNLSRKEIYGKLTRFGFNYGKLYKLLHQARKNSDECVVNIEVPTELFDDMSATTIHPSILDAMIQTYVILTGDETDKKEVLPISIGKVSVFRTPETHMYIYTKVKDRYGQMVVFDSQLTTLDGDIIVDMEDLTLKFLSSDADMDSAQHISRCHWALKVPEYPYTEGTDPHVLYISDEPVPPDVTSIEYSLDNDCSDIITGQLDMLKRSQMLDAFRYIIINISTSFDKSDAAVIIQSKIVNLCLSLKSIFCYPLKIAVYVFTRWALPADYATSGEHNVNPAMTSVWGMVRSALQEQSADIRIFDLHLPLMTTAAATTAYKSFLGHMTSVSAFVHKNEYLRIYTEWMVRENKLFVNEIIALSNNIIPAFRHISADRHKHILQVSNGPLGSTDTFCVYDESQKRDIGHDDLGINVHESALLHPKLFNLSVPYSSVVPHRSHLGNGSVVFVLETTGKQDDQSGEKSQREIISCYPSPIGSQISVPARATVPRDMFADYCPGDLTRLALLLSLSADITDTAVTILMSSQTAGLAEILGQMITSNLSRRQASRQVECLTLEQVDNVRFLQSTVVSLILLDSNITSTLIKHWPQAECLVTVAPLVSQSVICLMTYHMPNIKVILMDPSQTFQPRNLLELIPKVKAFLADHKLLVSRCLGGGREDKLTERFPEVTSDLHELLKAHAVQVNRSTVRIDQHLLFKKEAVYIVVGGLTGLGWITVQFLCSQGAGHIAILGRSAPGEDKRKQIQELSVESTCDIQWFQCDVRDTDSFSNFLHITAATDFPHKPIKGIFFGAVANGDAILSNVTRDNLEHVLAPKVIGGWNAHVLTEGLDLDYFVLQSSVTSMIGNFGQTAYGAANGFLDGLASYRRHRNLPAQSINWGPLNVGMLANNEKARQSLTQRGMNLLTEEEIMSLMAPVLLLDFGQAIVWSYDKDQWQKNPLTTIPGSASYEMPVSNVLRQLLHRAPEMSQQDRFDVYMQLLVVLAAQIIGIDSSMVQADTNLQELGMDSLLAMSLRNEVFKITQCRLPAVVFVSGAVTVTVIAQALEAELQKDTDC